jgi:hypothetical protein
LSVVALNKRKKKFRRRAAADEKVFDRRRLSRELKKKSLAALDGVSSTKSLGRNYDSEPCLDL